MAKDSISPEEFGQIKIRHSERTESVKAFHSRSTVWCCSIEAEECFDDLTRLLQIFDAANN